MQEKLPLIELKNIHKKFGVSKILNGIDLNVHSGEVVALLGDNGAGKSTLIKILCGYHRPDEGEIKWLGNQISFSKSKGPMEARALGIETVHQNLSLINSMSIYRNFFLGRESHFSFCGIKLLNHKKMKTVTLEKLKEIGLTRKLNPSEPVEGLSGGEKQSIAISRAKYFGAKLIVLDEPTSALSIRQTKNVLNYSREAADAGLGVILITHTLSHIENLVDRIVVLKQGQKIMDEKRIKTNISNLSDMISGMNSAPLSH